jgi:hypothetical protein
MSRSTRHIDSVLVLPEFKSMDDGDVPHDHVQLPMIEGKVTAPRHAIKAANVP